MNRTCAYKDSLGQPGVGFHAARLGSFALWDIVSTIIIAIVLILYFRLNPVTTVIAITLLTIAIHWLFCVNTAGNMMLGL